MAAFATSTDMINRFDSRTLGDLVKDDRVKASEPELITNPKMIAALNTATGKILGACLRAKRYSREDLDNLTGESREYLVDMTCRIAFWQLIWQRKPYADDQQRQQAKQDADDVLELLRTGDHVFDVPDAINSGVPYVETVTRVEIERDWDLYVDKARGNFFPRRRSYRQR